MGYQRVLGLGRRRGGGAWLQVCTDRKGASRLRAPKRGLWPSIKGMHFQRIFVLLHSHHVSATMHIKGTQYLRAFEASPTN